MTVCLYLRLGNTLTYLHTYTLMAVCVWAGQSLVWVGILGVVILYIYALAGFAYLRDCFNPGDEDGVHCATLTQCFVTVIRYGLIGDYDGESNVTSSTQN